MKNIRTQHYRRFPEPERCNVADKTRYLTVNCAGICVLPHPFHSYSPHGRNDYYMLYLSEGNLSFASGVRAEEEMLCLHPGQLFVFPPNTSYRYEPADGSAICYYYIHFTGYGASRLLSECAVPVGTVCTVGFPEEQQKQYEALFRCFVSHLPCFETTAASCFAAICATFGNMLKNADAAQSGAKQLYTSLSYLHQNFDTDFSVAELAAMEQLSVSRYRELFHALTGESPIAYITRLRIARAEELLSQTDLSLRAISVSVGYRDPQYFSRIFRAKTGVSPSSFRTSGTSGTYGE